MDQAEWLKSISSLTEVNCTVIRDDRTYYVSNPALLENSDPVFLSFFKRPFDITDALLIPDNIPWSCDRQNVTTLLNASSMTSMYLSLFDAEYALQLIIGPFALTTQSRNAYREYCVANHFTYNPNISPSVISLGRLLPFLTLVYNHLTGCDIHYDPDSCRITTAVHKDSGWPEHGSKASAFAGSATDVSRHATYLAEKAIFDAIERGDIDKASNNMLSQTYAIGLMSSSSYKQFEYMTITNIILSSRAAIRGGMDPDEAYNLSDRYLRAASSSNTTSQLADINLACYREFLEAVHDVKSSTAESPYVEKAKRYIGSHLRDELSGEILADKLGLSLSYLNHLFSESEPLTLHQYILDSRLEAASNMLKYSDYRISEIANYYHFASVSHFAEKFKKKYACTPREYRRRHGRI